MNIPSKEVVRTKNLFNVSDVYPSQNYNGSW
jgi:uncharacterized protein with WD repeat